MHCVLRGYDEHLNEEERAFMTLFSAIRTPVAGEAFGRVFRMQPEEGGNEEEGDHKGSALPELLAALGDDEFERLVARLVG